MLSLEGLYWFMTVAGGAVLVLAFIFGELTELFEGMGQGIAGALGDLTNLDLGGDLDAGAGADGGSFSLYALFAFMTFFGATGLIGLNVLEVTEVQSVGIAAVSGLVAGFAANTFWGFLYGQQISTHLRSEMYEGATGYTVSRVPPTGLGKASIQVGNRSHYRSARSHNDAEIPANTQVEVIRREGHVVIVRPIGSVDTSTEPSAG